MVFVTLPPPCVSARLNTLAFTVHDVWLLRYFSTMYFAQEWLISLSCTFSLSSFVFAADCNANTTCFGNGFCSDVDGSCQCLAPFAGSSCSRYNYQPLAQYAATVFEQPLADPFYRKAVTSWTVEERSALVSRRVQWLFLASELALTHLQAGFIVTQYSGGLCNMFFTWIMLNKTGNICIFALQYCVASVFHACSVPAQSSAVHGSHKRLRFSFCPGWFTAVRSKFIDNVSE